MTIRSFLLPSLSALVLLPSLHASELRIKDGETVAFLGDSITAGGASYGGYCRLVIQGLKTQGVMVRGVYAGIPGNTSADMLLRLDRDVLDHKPDHVVLAAGVNDIWHGDPTVKIGVFQASPGMGVRLEHYTGYITRIVDRCEAAGASVILTTITPITEDPAFKLNRTAESYNAFLRRLARDRGLPLAELNESMFAAIAKLKEQSAAETGHRSRRNMISSDGVHPVAIGHRLMAKGVLRAMGLDAEAVNAAEQEWVSAPRLLVLGDRQSNAGARTGGWRHLVMDVMNAGRGMVSDSGLTRETLAEHVAALDAALAARRPRYLLVQAPLGDLAAATALPEYSAQLRALIAKAEGEHLSLAVATVPLRDAGPDQALNAKLRNYNDVLRTVGAELGVPLADIAAAMRRAYEEDPTMKLTIGDERLSHAGGRLMATAVLNAFGYPDELIASQRAVWDGRSSYTFQGSHRARFNVQLTPRGREALDEISARYHKVSPRRLVPHGLYLLLNDDAARNRARIASFDAEWLVQGGAEDAAPYEIYGELMPSARRALALKAYMEAQQIDREELFLRAFKVGMVVMRNEDLLGRGAY